LLGIQNEINRIKQEVNTQAALIAQITSVLDSKMSGGSAGDDITVAMSTISNNTTALRELLDTVNGLPGAEGGIELPTLTNEGVAGDLLQGKELIDADGRVVTGTMPIYSGEDFYLDIETTSHYLEQGFYEDTRITIYPEEKTVTPSYLSQIITPTAGKVLSNVTVHPIPNKYQDVSYVDATAQQVLEGYTIVDSDGVVIEGTMPICDSNDDILDTTTTTHMIPEGYHEGDGSVSIVLEEKTVTPTAVQQIITPSSGKVLSKVTVEAASGGTNEDSDTLDGLLDRTLTSITNDRITKLGQYAFSYNQTLEYASFPNVTHMSTRVFGNATALKELYLPNMSNYTYQYMCAYCIALTTVDVKKASYISSYSFYGCTSLTRLEFERANTIATNAFNGSSKLETLILRMDFVPTLGGTNAFTGTKIASGNGYIYVPSSLLESYRTASVWSTYSDQFRAIEDWPDICG
jgi:hypothetical protein